MASNNEFDRIKSQTNYFNPILPYISGEEGLNILINNAAVISSTTAPSNTSTDEITRCFNINVVATHCVTQVFSPLLINAAEFNKDKEVGCSRAFIMNVSSAVGSIANTTSAWNSAYRISKCGKSPFQQK